MLAVDKNKKGKTPLQQQCGLIISIIAFKPLPLYLNKATTDRGSESAEQAPEEKASDKGRQKWETGRGKREVM